MASVRERLNALSERRGECLEWVGYKTKLGYGRIFIGGKAVGAHRAAWEDANGKIPDGLFCCHKCDNRSCISLDHLFIGTRQDNIDDMVRKQRRRGVGGARGESHPLSKLADADIYAIRASGAPIPELIKAYNVSRARIYAIKAHTTWKHLK